MLNRVPARVFLDTSALNFILDHGESIFDGVPLPSDKNYRTKMDVDAFYNIFVTGQRASWQLAISPFTYSEIIRTHDLSKLHHLKNWFEDVWCYWLNVLQEGENFPSFVRAEPAQIQFLSSRILNVLPDPADKRLLCDAIVYRCDCFCTRDWRTILKYRDTLRALPISIITPREWWDRIRPFAALWV